MESGNECGLTLDGYSDYQEGDQIECLKVVWKTTTEAVLPGTSGMIRSENYKEKTPSGDPEINSVRGGK